MWRGGAVASVSPGSAALAAGRERGDKCAAGSGSVSDRPSAATANGARGSGSRAEVWVSYTARPIQSPFKSYLRLIKSGFGLRGCCA